jgi:hypothetical protein
MNMEQWNDDTDELKLKNVMKNLSHCNSVHKSHMDWPEI